MCCAIGILALLGPRFLLFVWWLVEPARWGIAFGNDWFFGLLGFIFVPWTTLAYVIVAPGGVDGADWLLIAFGLVVDVMTWGGGAFGNRDRIQSSYQ